jgi:hypothetical protein
LKTDIRIPFRVYPGNGEKAIDTTKTKDTQQRSIINGYDDGVGMVKSNSSSRINFYFLIKNYSIVVYS